MAASSIDTKSKKSPPHNHLSQKKTPRKTKPNPFDLRLKDLLFFNNHGGVPFYLSLQQLQQSETTSGISMQIIPKLVF